jgi:hypothetical protein
MDANKNHVLPNFVGYTIKINMNHDKLIKQRGSRNFELYIKIIKWITTLFFEGILIPIPVNNKTTIQKR